VTPAPSTPPCMAAAAGEAQRPPPPLVFNRLRHPQCLRIQHQEWGERVPLALLKQPLRLHPRQAQDHLRALVRLSLSQGNIRRIPDNLMLIGNLAVCQCIHPDKCPIPQPHLVQRCHRVRCHRMQPCLEPPRKQDRVLTHRGLPALIILHTGPHFQVHHKPVVCSLQLHSLLPFSHASPSLVCRYQVCHNRASHSLVCCSLV